MTQLQHTELASGKWRTLPFFEQMAHIGGEVERAIKWRKKGNMVYSRMAIERALELIDLTLYSWRSYPKLRELARVRECLVDDFYADNSYKSTDASWQKYFYPFTYAVAVRKSSS